MFAILILLAVLGSENRLPQNRTPSRRPKCAVGFRGSVGVLWVCAFVWTPASTPSGVNVSQMFRTQHIPP